MDSPALRAIVLAPIVGLVLASGCLSSTAPFEGSPLGPGTPEKGPLVSNGFPISGPPGRDDTIQVCETADGCTFWDDDYHEYTVYELDTAELDVLIVPAASATLTQTNAMAKAVRAWADGAQAFGADWFRDGFRINAYVVGQDSIPPAALQDPEIVVLGAEVNPLVLFGIGLEPKQILCAVMGEGAERSYRAHAHDGMEVRAADCTGYGFTCFAINSSFLDGGAIYMQDLVAHEVGHCLGGGHVGDALDFSAKLAPRQDIMSYQHNETHVHCVSNMNVRVLEDVYAGILGHSEADLHRVGEYTTFPLRDYRHVLCEN